MTHWECKVCPFTTTWEDAARGHIEAAPPRGWLGEGEKHSLSLIVEPVQHLPRWRRNPELRGKELS